MSRRATLADSDASGDDASSRPPTSTPLPRPLTSLIGSAKTGASMATTTTAVTASVGVLAVSDAVAAEAPAALAKEPDPGTVPPAVLLPKRDGNATFSTPSTDVPHIPPPPSTDALLAPYPYIPEPLLQDVSFFSSPYARVARDAEGTTLSELAHLVRLSKYQERKRENTRLRLQLSLISTALCARFVRCSQSTHRALAECFRNDDRTAFAHLYNAVHDVRKSCAELQKYALLKPELNALRSPVSIDSLDTTTASGILSYDAPPLAGSEAYVVSFLAEISTDSRDTLIAFLTNLRTNPDYLATRLCCLNSVELGALIAFHKGMEPFDTMLPYHSRSPPSIRSSGPMRFSTHSGSSVNGSGQGRDRNPIQKLLSFERHDPLSALIHTCFANSAGPDSSEDRRRTDIWATTCARLITEKGAVGEPVLVAVLNAWSDMRPWTGRSNMEWYLIKILEEGAFLLDRAEDQNGTRFNLSEWTANDQAAAEEFYGHAIDELFEVVDDEDATGIPEGFIELGTQILNKLDATFVDGTRSWLVYRWLFGTWLLGVVIHPESYGLMAEYHITEYGRQKILREVAVRAYRIVVETIAPYSHIKPTGKPLVAPQTAKMHVDSILDRFRGKKAGRPTTRLLPARSITSLRETTEVHPYLVVSPADLVTMVNTLFPNARPRSAYSSSIRSGTESVFSGPLNFLSQTAPAGNQRGTAPDSVSFMSTSPSTTGSIAPPVDAPLTYQRIGSSLSARYSPPPPSLVGQDQRKANNYEDDGYRLHLALQDMSHNLGHDVVLGPGHPCADRWAVLFVSADGNALSLNMACDKNGPDFGQDTNSSSSGAESAASKSEDDDTAELQTDYHQLRDAILKLVEDFEIPRDVEADGGKVHTFSNRANRLKKYRTKSSKGFVTAETARAKVPSGSPNRNPYWKHMQSLGSEKDESGTANNHDTSKTWNARSATSADSGLIAMLDAASSQSRAQSDFLAAHQYWKTIQQLKALTSESLRRNGFSALLNIFSRGPRDSIRRSTSAVEEYDAWLIWLRQSQERTEGLIGTMMMRSRSLRDKMWYVTDVRSSAPYEFSRNIAVALKTMGTKRKWTSYQRSRQNASRGGSASYLFRSESEIVELLAASEEQGGPNKLSDDQAEKTIRWMEQGDIENFCQGEERIHRFSCEITSCLDKLVGESIIEAPVLWSSELYTRDRRYFEATRRSTRDRDMSGMLWDDSSSVQSFDSPVLGTTSVRAGPSYSSRFNFSKAHNSLSEILDPADSFSGSKLTSTPAIDTSATFWSPFYSTSPLSTLSRAQSPAMSSSTNYAGSFAQLNLNSRASMYSLHDGSGSIRTPSIMSSSGRPGTSTSSVDTTFQRKVADDKAQFLAELRQTLTSLLLSDLGNLVFARGSETDAWFSTLGQECIDRREATERSRRQEAVVERKRRMGRDSQQRTTTQDTDAHENHNDNLSPGGLPHEHSLSTNGQAGTPSTTADSESVPTKTDNPTYSKKPKAGANDFPFKKAYQGLLRMFCVHPNPHAKLNALIELENLIMASLSSKITRRRLTLVTKSGVSPVLSHANVPGNVATQPATAQESSGIGFPTSRARPLEDTIDHIKGRRSNTLASSLFLPTSGSHGEFRAGVGTGGPVLSSKDAVASVLQSLFRDAGVRPKTLFRDLQFIAAFVPSYVLDRTERGKAFWDTGLAALMLKREVRTMMIEVADEIVGEYTKTRKATTTTATAASSGLGATAMTPDGAGKGTAMTAGSAEAAVPTTTSMYSLADAARMWTITAKEGDPTSQRELAIFYLSNPELVERTILPLSKPREVFKKSLMGKYGGSSSSSSRHHAGHGNVSGTGSGNVGRGASSTTSGSVGSGVAASTGGVTDVRNDAALMCVAIHWMEAAEQGGDDLARAFLGQNEMMSGTK